MKRANRPGEGASVLVASPVPMGVGRSLGGRSCFGATPSLARRGPVPAMAILMGLLGCVDSRAVSSEVVTSEVFVSLVTKEACTSCIVLDDLVSIGREEEGFVEFSGSVVRDSRGRYWVGQSGEVRVFDSRGRYVLAVGRPGRGPMEFVRPEPRWATAAGGVLIFDAGAGRATEVSGDLKLRSEWQVPAGGIAGVAHLDRDRYVLSAYLEAPGRFGRSYHVLDGDSVLRSFGLIGGGSIKTPLGVQRRLASDSAGRIYGASLYEYRIERWTAEGALERVVSGPRMNSQEVRFGPFSLENPPAATIAAIEPAGGAALWILSWIPRDDWLEKATEVFLPNGTVGLTPSVPIDELYTSRIDLVDTDTGRLLSTRSTDRLLAGFVAKDAAFALNTLTSGVPSIDILQIHHSPRED